MQEGNPSRICPRLSHILKYTNIWHKSSVLDMTYRTGWHSRARSGIPVRKELS